MAFLPFSDLAKPWEKIGMRLRILGGAGRDGILDPWKLATEVGLRVFDDVDSLKTLDAESRLHLLRSGKNKWSAGVYPIRFPDGTHLCILNPTHSRRRQKISLMEEIVHQHLNHKPSRITFSENGICIRDFDKEDEGEAYGVGAAALLPWHLFFPLVNAGATKGELSIHFDVSPDLIEYRLKVTAALRLYRAKHRRQRARRY